MAIPLIGGIGSRMMLGQIPRAVLSGTRSLGKPNPPVSGRFSMDLTMNSAAVKARLMKRKKQLPFAVSKALSELAYDAAREHLPRKTDQIFEGGATNFTQKAFRFKRATKRKLVSSVYVADNRVPYLKYMISDRETIRPPKNRAVAIPTYNVKKNEYGNVSRARWKTLVGNEERYFKGIPKQFGKDENKAGIWQIKRNKLKRLVAYKDQARYPKVYFPYHDLLRKYGKSSQTGFRPRFFKAYRYALRTAK
jgi:hypothetical protein